jgi:hypothetical protein
MDTQLIKEIKKEIDVFELAIETLQSMTEFHQDYNGTDICYSPIKLLKKELSSLYYRLTIEKDNVTWKGDI